MKAANPSILNPSSLRKAYVSACRARSIRPRKKGFNDFVKLVESDSRYWMNANLKFFFEAMNH